MDGLFQRVAWIDRFRVAQMRVSEACSPGGAERHPGETKLPAEPRISLRFNPGYAYAQSRPHLRSLARPEAKPASHARMVLRRFRKEVLLAGFAAEAQASMVVADKA
jgi:hypothetical protein